MSHKVDVATVADFAVSRLGADPTQGMSALDWLSVTGQSVLEVTAGPVFSDRTRTWRGPGRCSPGTRRMSSVTCWPRDGSGCAS